MSKKPPFWRWLTKVLLVKPIRKIPEFFKLLIELVMDPIFEIIMGAFATYCVALYSLVSHVSPTNMKVEIALLIIPSLLIIIHGIYRGIDQ